MPPDPSERHPPRCTHANLLPAASRNRAGRRAALALLALLAALVQPAASRAAAPGAQPASHGTAPGQKMTGPRPKTSPAQSASPFAVAAWASLELSSTAPSTIGAAQIDLHVHDEPESIIVTGKHYRWESVPKLGDLLGSPDNSLAATPRDRPAIAPNFCAGSAYQTIAGQPATGRDLVGYGAGRCQ